MTTQELQRQEKVNARAEKLIKETRARLGQLNSEGEGCNKDNVGTSKY